MTQKPPHISIPGVLLTPAKRIVVEGGDVITFVKNNDIGIVGVVEVYGSFIKQGVRKVWRRHNSNTLNIVVPVGRIRFVLFDDREGRNIFNEVTLDKENYQRLTVPPGVWMAFEGLAAGENLLWNAINQPHDHDEADKKELNAIPYIW